MTRIILILSSVLILGACNRNDEGEVLSSELTTTTESAVSTLSAIMDDMEGESYALKSEASQGKSLEDLLFPKAYADGCIRPVRQTCEDGEKNSIFDDCLAFRGGVTINGFANLAFSDASCSMANPGDEVTRTYDYTLSGPRGGSISVSSAVHNNYEDQSLGGGAHLTRTESGWDLSILGKRKIMSRNGRVVGDKSIRTLEDLEITGGLRRSERRVSNGQLEVTNNSKEFTALFTANDLAWTSTCCHPVSGSLSVEFSGSKSGLGEVAFNGCGSITVEVDGEIQNDELTYCE